MAYRVGAPRLGYDAAMLVRFADDIWTEARRAKFWGLETGSRMTIVRLANGGLFVHSPLGLDDATRAEVDALGPVRAVVAPSLFHHLHVSAWMKAYPGAVFAAIPGLEWKRPDLAFTSVLGDQRLDAWTPDLEQVYFSSRRENEVVFFHTKSRTMICADALLNLSKHDQAWTRFVASWIMWNREPGTGPLEHVMVRNRDVARRQVDRILSWDIDRIILSHGALVERDGREIVRRAYAWL